ncbi:SpaA isopeptide-forming pilin-related protein [Pseudoscardovia suis]
MRHQVERLKHVAPKHGVKPVCALTAALAAVAMMVTMAVTSVAPSRNANAADTNNEAGICTPKSVSLGTNTGVGTEDTGIATYVGGDMYVGQKVSGDMKNTSGPAGSYAAEAEGLTAVNGKLLLHPLKGVWTTYYTDADGAKNGYVKDYRGFRFGIVGFGGQYRPKTGSSTLEVRGNRSDSNIGWVGGAQSWGNAGWIGQTKDTEPNYTANIAGAQTKVYGGSSNDILGNSSGSSNTNKNKYDNRASVYVPEGTQGTVNWGQNDNQIGSTGETFDGFGSYIKTLSDNLSNLSKQQSESVYVADAKTTTDSEDYNDLIRAKFDGTYSFKISSVHEKIIEFVGNGTSSMQVFNLPANMLNDSSTYTGVSFSFKNIPDTSSVVINVTGGDVVFHNGWRFWWTDMNNTKKELGGSYTDGDYAKRAQQIMWNFADASSVTIRGGQGSGKTTRKDANSAAEKADGVWAGSFSLTTNDDPAAGMLGSILVPKGSFESHVSTNGRVWVGGNFAMYNPEAVGNTGQDNKFYEFVNYERSHSASALDMDQERHNLPWNGSYSTQCAAIAWDKVDASNQAALGDTTWAVYASNSDAQSQSNALKTVTDNAYGDDDSKQGSFSIGGLNPSAIYYIREVSANNTDYGTNTNIYTITAGGEGSTARVVTNVYDSEGNEITDSNKKLLPSVGDNSTNAEIANKKSGTSIEWSKVDGTDNSTLLAGSTWTLSKMSGDTAEQSWDITDDQSGTEVKSVKIFDADNNEVASASFTNSTAQQFHAVAYDQNSKPIDNAKLTWSSDDSAVVAVSENGLVTPTGNGNTTITVKSADGKVTASFTVEVSGVTVETSVSIKDYINGQEISLEKGKTLNLIASVAPAGNTVTWSTSNADNVSLSATTGTSVTLTANKVTSSPVTITAQETRTGKTVTLRVNVTKPPATTTTVFFKMQDNFNQNNGQKLFLEWKTSNGNWPADNGDQPNRKEMTVASGCNGYVSYTINEVMPTSASFRIRRDKAGWTTPGSFYRPGENSGFAFNGGDIVTLNTATEILDTAPSGCAVISTVAYSSRRAAASSGEYRAVASVLRTQGNVVNVAENSAVPSKKDENTAAGKFKVSDLADGTYRLQEKTAPNGYEEVPDTVYYTITIKNGQVTWDHKTDNKLPNKRKTGTVTWNKVSSDSANDKNKKLGGSEWKLTKTKSFGWNTGKAEYTDIDIAKQKVIKITDCKSETVKTCPAPAEGQEIYDVDPVEGQFKLTGLEWGTYTLVESKAPDGYDVDSTVRTFTFGPVSGSDGTGKWNSNSAATGNFTTSDADYDSSVFTFEVGDIKNQPGVILPATGGEGSNKMYAAGFLAVAIAMIGLALSLKRRQS